MTPSTWDIYLSPGRWGQGRGSYTEAELREIAANIAPALAEPTAPPRLRAADLPRDAAGIVQVPAGYDWSAHPNRASAPPELLDAEFATHPAGSPQLPAPLAALGDGDRDQHGRLLHPHWRALLAGPGLPTGLGQFFHWGEAVVVDAVVWRERLDGTAEVLLGERDTPHEGTIVCLPGGFATATDEDLTTAQWNAGQRSFTASGIKHAALRKAREETGVPLDGGEACEIMRAIRPISSVHTLHAWSVVFTVLIRADRAAAQDRRARWQRVDQLDTVLDDMWPDHRRALLASIAPGATPLTMTRAQHQRRDDAAADARRFNPGDQVLTTSGQTATVLGRDQLMPRHKVPITYNPTARIVDVELVAAGDLIALSTNRTEGDHR